MPQVHTDNQVSRMKARRKLLATLTLVGAAALLSGCNSNAQEEESVAEAAPACDRACLIETTNDYIAALVAHQPTGVPLAENIAFVEDLKRISPGEGLWQTATAGPTTFSIHVPDERNQTAGWMGMMEKEGEPVLVALRLKLQDGRITEAEHLTTGIQEANMERMQTPRPGLLAEVPADARLPHDELIRIAASYYDALDDNDGSLTPFAEDCERHENGMLVAGPGPRVGPGPNNNTAPIARDCAGQLTSGVMTYITSIDNRRVFAADPVTGLVMGFSHFRHPMDFEPYEVTALDGSKIMYGKDRLPFEPFDLPAGHVFKIGADGKMHEIEAMGFMAPLNSPTGWE